MRDFHPDSGPLAVLASPDLGPETAPLPAIRAAADAQNRSMTIFSLGDATPETIADHDPALGIAVGGDGTFLEGVRHFTPTETPFLAINAGTLGFLARIHPTDTRAALTAVESGEGTIIERERVTVTGGGLDASGINDVMIEPLPATDPTDRKICRLHAYIDDEYVGQFNGSGLAVSTPTGSTAVALSAGGPIHYPNANSTLQLTPLHTHNIGVRPVIVDGESTITVIPDDEVRVMVDGGRTHTRIAPETELTLTGADTPTQIIRTAVDETFFDALADKLGWSLRDVDDPGPY